MRHEPNEIMRLDEYHRSSEISTMKINDEPIEEAGSTRLMALMSIGQRPPPRSRVSKRKRIICLKAVSWRVMPIIDGERYFLNAYQAYSIN